jgi:hypothetical protein
MGNGSTQVVHVPANDGFQYKAKAPKMKAKGTDVTIKHTEYVGQFNVSDEVGNLYFDSQLCNPLNPVMFPWLSLLSRAYEKFKIKKMTFRYQTSASTFANGSSFIFIDYEATDAPPRSLNDMAQSSEAFVMKAIYSQFSLDVVPSKLNQTKTYNIDVITGETDPALILLACPFKVYWGTIQTTVSQSPGYLYIDYEIELLQPTSERNETIFNYFAKGPQQLSDTNGFEFNPQVWVNNIDVAYSSSEPFFTPVLNGLKFTKSMEGSLTLIVNATGMDASRPLNMALIKGDPRSSGELGQYYRQIKDIGGGVDTWNLIINFRVEKGDTLNFNGALTDGSEVDAVSIILSISTSTLTYWNQNFVNN